MKTMISNYKQFNVWYYDFRCNDKRCRTFARIEDALEFVKNMVDNLTAHQSRFLKLESIY